MLQRCKLLLSLNNENIFTMLQTKIGKYIGKIYFAQNYLLLLRSSQI